MDKVIEFSSNHWPLVFSFVILVLLALRNETKGSGKAISVHEMTGKINSENAVVLDIRESKEFKEGSIVDAINIPTVKLDSRLVELDKYKETPLVVVCQMGQQAGQAVRKLEAAGFTQVFRLQGGISTCRSESFPLVKS